MMHENDQAVESLANALLTLKLYKTLSLDDKDLLPETAGIYALYHLIEDGSPEWLYIGESINLRKRLGSHHLLKGKALKDVNKAAVQVRFWSGTVFETTTVRKRIEEIYINSARPRFNQALDKQGFKTVRIPAYLIKIAEQLFPGVETSRAIEHIVRTYPTSHRQLHRPTH